MRYLLGALVLAAGCGPQAVPTDAPPSDTPPAWAACGPACAPSCNGVTFDVTCEDVVGSGVDCSGCIPLCGVPRLYDRDAEVPEQVTCEERPGFTPRWECPTGEAFERIGSCWRPTV